MRGEAFGLEGANGVAWRAGRLADSHDRDAVGRALSHLKMASVIMDHLVADDMTNLHSHADTAACHRIAEASHAIHLAVLAATECITNPRSAAASVEQSHPPDGDLPTDRRPQSGGSTLATHDRR